MSPLHENAIGAVITYTVLDAAGVALDISTASVKELIFKKPDGSVVTKTAAFTTDGSDGKINYSTVAGDLEPYGTYQVQARIVTPTINGRADVSVFDVLKNV